MAVYRYGKKTSDINVQSDFSVKDLNNDAYIKNRPDSTLSISLDGVEQEKQYNPNTGGEINVLLTIPKKVQSSNPYISTSVKIDISLISGNFNFNLYEMTNETMSAFHGSGNYYSSEPFESNTQVVVPVNPSIKPSKDGALWISTT